MHPNARRALAMVQIELFGVLEMHPNAPECTRMPPVFSIWQNEPTVASPARPMCGNVQ
jgi:hypothetical protein